MLWVIFRDSKENPQHMNLWRIEEIIYTLSLNTDVSCFADKRSRLTTKPTMWPVRPAKIKISLGVGPV